MTRNSKSLRVGRIVSALALIFSVCAPAGAAAQESEPLPFATSAAKGAENKAADATAALHDTLLKELAPEGWQQAGEIEHYTVENLYVKINGRSELYMAYDVEALSWVSFISGEDETNFIDLFLYDMGSPNGAFGIFSVEREPGQPPAALGRQGYRTDANHYFWKGRYYVYVQTANEDEAAQRDGLAVASGLNERLQDSVGGVTGLDDLPRQGLVEDTIQYFRVDAMSLDFMKETFTARYRMGDALVTVFVSDRGEEKIARLVQEQYVGYLVEYGENPERLLFGDVGVGLSDLGGGFYDAMFRIGAKVYGVSGVEGRDPVVKAVETLLRMVLEP